MPRLPGVERSERIVCHVDVDCFYAACERIRKPKLDGEPVVVGMGYEPGETHGAVATASYEAREHGVESAMAISEALERLPRRTDTAEANETGCYRPVDMAFYESVSEDVRAVLRAVSSTVREVSIDEAYLAVDELAWPDAESFGRSLKQEIESEVGVVASVGVAPDMTTAKLASDADKPDGLVVVEPDDVRSFLAPIGVEDLHGVGPVTASKLREMGFRTGGDIAEANVGIFVDAFGDRGRDLHRQARGEDDRTVEPTGKPKSLSSESAFVEPTSDPETKQQKIRELADEVTGRAEATDALYRTIGIKTVTPPFDVHTRSRSLPGPIDDPDLAETISLDLLAEFESVPVRKLGVRLSNLSFDDREQATITEWATERGEDETRAFRTGSTRGDQTDLSRFN
jgi:DNA polymerase IV (DinB-like DNA polymerase)